MVSESVLSGNSAAANVLVFFAHVPSFLLDVLEVAVLLLGYAHLQLH